MPVKEFAEGEEEKEDINREPPKKIKKVKAPKEKK
jgi:hypothetical protein